MNEDLAIQQFKRDFVIQTVVQEEQFVQWLRLTFFLNDELSKKSDFIYQDIFYVKLYELLTEGLKYASSVLTRLSNNKGKRIWYNNLVASLNDLVADLSDDEFNYIEYRRHSASHIFQDTYEHIQKDSLKIRKIRNGKDLSELNQGLQSLIQKFGSDEGVDQHLNKKIHPKLSDAYKMLIS